MTESAAGCRLRLIPEEFADSSKSAHDARAKVEAASVSFGGDFDVEIIEAIVSIEVEPVELHL